MERARDIEAIDNEIRPERTLAEVFRQIAQLNTSNRAIIADLRLLIPAYVQRLTIQQIEESPPEPFDNLVNLNAPGELAKQIFGSNLFRRIVGLSQTPAMWTTSDPPTPPGPVPTSHTKQSARRQLMPKVLKPSNDEPVVTKQIYYIVNQGLDGYTLREATNATFGVNPPAELRRILARLKATHLDTPISDMPEQFRIPTVSSEGQAAIDWFRPKVASFILQNGPPDSWVNETGQQGNREADLDYIQSGDPDVALRKPRTPRHVTDVPQVNPTKQPVAPILKSPVPLLRRAVGFKAGNKRNLHRGHAPGMSKSAVRRLARKAGVKRISESIYDETRLSLRTFLNEIIRSAAAYAVHANRKTITLNDIHFALKFHGHTLYGLH
jgi:histone H4